MTQLDPHFSPHHLLDCSTDGLVPAAAYAAIERDQAEWSRRYGGASAASPTAVPPSRGGADPVGRMAADIAALFRDHDGYVSEEYLVTLGWDPNEIARHGRAARARAARLLEREEPVDLPARLRTRRRAGSRRQAGRPAA